MKTYMPLNGLRWSRNSGSANCDMPQSAVFGRPGGVKEKLCIFLQTKIIQTNDLLTLNYFYYKLIKTTKVWQRI